MIWGIVAFFLAVIGVLVWLLLRPHSHSSLSLIQQQLTHLNEQVHRALGDVSASTSTEMGKLHQRFDERLSETARILQSTHQSVGERIDKNTAIFGQVQDRLGKLEEANKYLRDMAEEIGRLQEILRVPKLRGNLGELFLEELLSQILPPTHYEMQHEFHSGEKVDAIVRLPQGHLLPIDAKFPLENFRRLVSTTITEEERKTIRKTFASDVKKHVDQIAHKYILPNENTLDFALMYIPAENVYYEVIVHDDRLGESLGMNAYALGKKVIPVSPSSLYVYLQLIVLGLRGLRIETRAKEIISFISQLNGDLLRLQDEFDVAAKHLGNTSSAFEKSLKRLFRVRENVRKVETTDHQIEVTPSVELSEDRAPAARAVSRSE